MNKTRIAIVVATVFLPAAIAMAADTEMAEIRTKAERVRAGSPNDVVITGSKTDTQLKDLPASVVVVPSELLRQQGTLDMNRAMENASGVQPVQGGAYGFANNYSIRGMAMRFLRDGLPDGTSQNGYWRTMYDFDRIEVLKGPGSALYGSGQPGGTVNVVTKQPRARFGSEIGALAGSFGTWGAYADTTGAIGTNLSARLIADVEKSDGFRGLGRNIKEISPTFTWALADDKTLTLDFDHREIKVKPDNYGVLFDARGNIAAPRDARFYSLMSDTDQTINRVTLSHEWRINADLTMRTAVLNDDRDLHLTRNAGTNGGNAAGVVTGRQLRDQNDDTRFSMLQNEVVWKASTGAIKHTVLGGVEYNSSSADTVRNTFTLPNIANVAAPVVTETAIPAVGSSSYVLGSSYNRNISSHTWGLYLQDQIEMSEQVKLRAGLRNDRVHANDTGTVGSVARTIKVDDSINSGSLGAVWQPTRDLSLYAGYSSGGFVNLSTESNAINTKPETSSQKEAGMKANFLDGRYSANVAVFDNRRNDYYITLPGATDATPDGKDRTRGIEFDLTVHPIAGLSLLANFVVQNPETLSRSVASNAIFGVSNRSIYGMRPSGVAKQTARVWGTYEFQEASLRGWGVGAGATYKGDSYADSLNLYNVPGYTIYDAAVFYKTKKWDATLNLRNLTDRVYYTNPTGAGAIPGEPRSAMLTVRMRFE